MYDELNPDLGPFLVTNLILDLICLSDREPELGNVDEECAPALKTYERFVKENEEMVGYPGGRKCGGKW